MNTILIPLDGSEQSARILSFVDRLPAPQEPDLILLRVVPKIDAKRVREPERKAQIADALERLWEVEDALRDRGLRPTSLVTRADPGWAGEQILRLIRITKPTLVAMATRGGGETADLRGSVAKRVVERCPVPLLMGNAASLPLDPGLGFAKILVPLDGTETSARVLRLVSALATHHASEVLLFTVDPHEAADDALAATLKPFERQLREAGVQKVRIMTASGDEATEILAAVDREGPDLLAMTSHSRPDPRKRWFGSVAEAVVTRCGAPLLLDRVHTP